MNKKQKEVLIKLGMQNGFKLADLVGKIISFRRNHSYRTKGDAKRGILTRQTAFLITSAREQQWTETVGRVPFDKEVSREGIVLSIFEATFDGRGGLSVVVIDTDGIIFGNGAGKLTHVVIT